MSNNTTINKLYYSFYIEGESRLNPYQVYIRNEDLVDDPFLLVPFDSIELRKERFIGTGKYDEKFLWCLFSTNIMEVFSFLSYHYEEYGGIKEDFLKKISLLFSSSNQETLLEHYDMYEIQYVDHNQLHDHINEVKRWLDKQYPEVPFAKLKWKGKTAQFGIIFSQLFHKGYIEYPGSDSGYSPLNFAKHCLNHYLTWQENWVAQILLLTKRTTIFPPLKQVLNILFLLS